MENFIKIDIGKFKGSVPSGYDFVIAEERDIINSACVLYGFDEVGLFDHEFSKPVYGFLKIDTI